MPAPPIVRIVGAAVFSAFATTAVAETPQEAYATWCGRCHQFDGKGVPGVYPALDGSALVVGDAKLLARLVVDGGFPNNAMPAFRNVLTDEQIATILTYLRSAWSNRAAAVTPTEVAERQTP